MRRDRGRSSRFFTKRPLAQLPPPHIVRAADPIATETNVKLVAAILALLLAAPALATDHSTDLVILEKLNSDWLNSYKSRDVATLDRVLADDFEAIYPGGQVRTKADLLKGLANPSGTFETIAWDRLKILVFGDTAMVSGVTHITGKNAQGAPFSSSNDYADIYVRRDGTWRAVSAHVVRATP